MPCSFWCRAKSISLLLGIFHNTNHDVLALVNAQNTGVQTNVIVLCLTPGPSGIVLLIHPAALIHFGKTCLGALLGFTVEPHNALCPVGGIRKDINV